MDILLYYNDGMSASTAVSRLPEWPSPWNEHRNELVTALTTLNHLVRTTRHQRGVMSPLNRPGLAIALCKNKELELDVWAPEHPEKLRLCTSLPPVGAKRAMEMTIRGFLQRHVHVLPEKSWDAQSNYLEAAGWSILIETTRVLHEVIDAIVLQQPLGHGSWENALEAAMQHLGSHHGDEEYCEHWIATWGTESMKTSMRVVNEQMGVDYRERLAEWRDAILLCWELLKTRPLEEMLMTWRLAGSLVDCERDTRGWIAMLKSFTDSDHGTMDLAFPAKEL